MLTCLPLYLCLPSGLLRRPCSTSWTSKCLFGFSSSVLLLSFFFSFYFLAFRLVSSCRPSVGPSPRHIIVLILSANSNLGPSGLGLLPARMHEVFLLRLSFLLFLFILYFLPLLAFLAFLCVTVLSSSLCRVYACTTAMFLVLSCSK